MSHAGAFSASPSFELRALCDVDPGRLAECGAARGVRNLYRDYRILLAEERLDVLSLCTAVNVRREVIEAAIEAGVRCILCEKPFAADLGEARAIHDRVREAGVVLVVNHPRRWAPVFRSLGATIASGVIGDLQNVCVRYGKGLSNNGSHVLDVLDMLLGPPESVRTLRQVEDGRVDDPSLDCVLTYRVGSGAIPAYLLASDHRAFSQLEWDVIGHRGRVRIDETGWRVERWDVQHDAVHDDYRVLAPVPLDAVEHGTRLSRVVEEVARLCRNPDMVPTCGTTEALRVMAVSEAIRQSFRSGDAVALDSVERN